MTPQRLALAAALTLCVALPAPSVLAAGGAGAEQPAETGSRLEANLSIYAAGVAMGKIDLDATLRPDAYHVVANFETSGVLNTVWQAQIQATSSGKLLGKALEPSLYDSFTLQHSGKKQQVSLTYDGGAPKLFADPTYPMTGFEVTPEQEKKTLDPLSAALLIVSGVAADANNPCALTAPVFDGRRRYNLEFTKVRDLDIKLDSGLYKGKAVQCQIKYDQIAGWRPGVLKAKDSFPLINAWLVSFPSAVAGRSYTMPVKVWADTKYGQFVVLATALKIDGQPVH